MTIKGMGAVAALALPGLAGLALPGLAGLAQADWRAELRANMNPEGKLLEELDYRGGVILNHDVGDRYVQMSWDDDLTLSVDGNPVTDLQDWIEDEGSVVIAFVAYDGLGSFGTTETYGLRGWVYLDDLGGLRVELDVENLTIIYLVDTTGTPDLVTMRPKCECRIIGGWDPNSGCKQHHCTNGMNCPTANTNMLCEINSGTTIVQFEDTFELLTE